jgi:hypothetical protein
MTEIDYKQELADVATDLNNWAGKVFEQNNELLMEGKNAFKLKRKQLSLIENAFLLDYLSSKLDQAGTLVELENLRVLCSALAIVVLLPTLNLDRINEPGITLTMFLLGCEFGASNSFYRNVRTRVLYLDHFHKVQSKLFKNKGLEPIRKEIDQALKLAETKWEKGDDCFHHEMAEYLINKKDSSGKKMFPSLTYNILKRELKPLARKYGRCFGDKGVTRDKKT